MVRVLDPGYQDLILDPAGGSGGFLTGAMRHVRQKILSSKATSISKQRQLDRHRTRLFMVEISKRLVKIAKTGRSRVLLSLSEQVLGSENLPAFSLIRLLQAWAKGV